MSKKKVLAALLAATEGRIEDALRSLADVDRAFIRRRLAHFLAHGAPHERVAADILWKKFFPAPAQNKAILASPESLANPEFSRQPLPRRIDVEQPEPFLAWLTGYRQGDELLQMDYVELAQVWGLVGLAALHLAQSARVILGKTSEAARFARAVGFDEILTGQRTQSQHEEGRTVRLRRVTRYQEIESTSEEMSRLIAPAHETKDVRVSIRYVLIELLRNVIQHSENPAGGVAAAQLMNLGPYVGRPMIQIAVADAGIGIPAHLSRMHQGVEDPRVALERSLWPHISGTFPLGLTGSGDNAGLGLFFIAELAKRTHGRLLVATRGAALVLSSREDIATDRVVPRFLQPTGIGFPGTIVVFEIPTDTVESYTHIHQEIHQSALTRTPKRSIHRWVRYELPAGNIVRVRVRDLNENTAEAAGIAKDRIGPAIFDNRTVVVDFADIEVCTQSFLHALLYEALRLAWAKRWPIYVINADGPVRSGIEFLESYALGG